MYLIANNERIECTKAEKGADFINVYDNNNIISAFLGISNFSGFSVEGGDFTTAPLDDITQLQLAIAELAELVVGVFKVAQIYYDLIKKGLKTIDDVPERWRAAVQALLDADN